jgi:hypothetical protein
MTIILFAISVHSTMAGLSRTISRSRSRNHEGFANGANHREPQETQKTNETGDSEYGDCD